MEPKQIVLVGLLVALVVGLHVTGVLVSGSTPDTASPSDDRDWPEIVSGVLHAIPGLARDLAPDDVSGLACVDLDGGTATLVGCSPLPVPEGVDRVVLTLSEPACIVTAVTPGQLSQSYDAGDVDDDGLLRIPIAGDDTTLQLGVTTGTAVCRAVVATE